MIGRGHTSKALAWQAGRRAGTQQLKRQPCPCAGTHKASMRSLSLSEFAKWIRCQGYHCSLDPEAPVDSCNGRHCPFEPIITALIGSALRLGRCVERGVGLGGAVGRRLCGGQSGHRSAPVRLLEWMCYEYASGAFFQSLSGPGSVESHICE
eukprot:31936-Eustigmatos_ZCMA.PRE.1